LELIGFSAVFRVFLSPVNDFLISFTYTLQIDGQNTTIERVNTMFIFSHFAPAAIVATGAAYLVKLSFAPVLDVLASLPL
jgi:hypothetical protein